MRLTSLRPSMLAVLALAPALTAAALGDPGATSPSSGEHAPERTVRRAIRPVPGQYIVVLRDTLRAEEVDGEVGDLARRYNGQALGTWRHALRGFVMRMNGAQAAALAADPRVAWAEEDAEIRIDATQIGAPWGLDRIDQRSRPLDGLYTYALDGTGVNVYVIDTGIRTTHGEFGGRASVAFTAIKDAYGGSDCNGHGTHVAGVVGGAVSGVAKNAHLFSVRVLDCGGSGKVSGVISGVDWVTAHHVSPAVANMSLGGRASAALDRAVQNSVNAGITYVVAAANDSADACTTSPARVPGVLTVAASSGSDVQAWFSNFGTCVDLFAPGVDITSSWATNDGAMNTLSGTSMAAPHVSGAVALYLSADRTATPAQVAAALVSSATAGVLTQLAAGSPNRLLYAGSAGGGTPTNPWPLTP